MTRLSDLADAALRAQVGALQAQVGEQAQELERLKDDISRLRGALERVKEIGWEASCSQTWRADAMKRISAEVDAALTSVIPDDDGQQA